MNCVIIYNRLFERYDVYNESGEYCGDSGSADAEKLIWLSKLLRNSRYVEHPLNSKEGQRIVAKIGTQRV